MVDTRGQAARVLQLIQNHARHAYQDGKENSPLFLPREQIHDRHTLGHLENQPRREIDLDNSRLFPEAERA